MWQKKKRRRKTYPDLFQKSLTISWKVFGELCFTAFCGQLQIWVMPCNQSLPGTFTEAIRGIRNKMLEAESRMRRWAGETCTGFLDAWWKNSWISPVQTQNRALIQCHSKLNLECFPPPLMAWRLYWLKDRDQIISLWLFYWLQGTRNNGYNMKPYCLRESGEQPSLKNVPCLIGKYTSSLPGKLSKFLKEWVQFPPKSGEWKWLSLTNILLCDEPGFHL